jgi:hypothetical protein
MSTCGGEKISEEKHVTAFRGGIKLAALDGIHLIKYNLKKLKKYITYKT